MIIEVKQGYFWLRISHFDLQRMRVMFVVAWVSFVISSRGNIFLCLDFMLDHKPVIAYERKSRPKCSNGRVNGNGPRAYDFLFIVSSHPRIGVRVLK